MRNFVVPAPLRFDDDGAPFVLRSGTRVAHTAPDVGPIIERFCAEVDRRTGLRLLPVAGESGRDGPCIRIELVAGDSLGRLPSPAGLSPEGGGPPDERHAVAIDADRIVVRAAQPVGVARALTTLVQLLAASPDGAVPGGHVLDTPRYAWRGLSLDVARTYFAPEEIRRVIDLLALYKLNVLHLHLTDDQAWRLPVGRGAGSLDAGAPFFRVEDLRAIVSYAAERFVTVVPEIDTPGHATALMRMHPQLSSGRNEVAEEFVPGHPYQVVWLDPDLPATFELMERVLTGVADLFPGPYIHIGADEPFGMPHDLYASYVTWLRDAVRATGKRPLGWQESARAGLGPDDVIQYWFSDIAMRPSLPPEVQARMDADRVLSRRDIEAAVAASVPVIVSPQSNCYLDVPYAEPSADPAQAERQGRVGLPFYAPRTVAESFDWEPAEALGPGGDALVAGVEAAIWAESLADFDDLSFLLLPRLAGVAHKAWSDPRRRSWEEHLDRIARHERLWDQDGLTYYAACNVRRGLY